jgi:hypothetical protein
MGDTAISSSEEQETSLPKIGGRVLIHGAVVVFAAFLLPGTERMSAVAFVFRS